MEETRFVNRNEMCIKLFLTHWLEEEYEYYVVDTTLLYRHLIQKNVISISTPSAYKPNANIPINY